MKFLGEIFISFLKEYWLFQSLFIFFNWYYSTNIEVFVTKLRDIISSHNTKLTNRWFFWMLQSPPKGATIPYRPKPQVAGPVILAGGQAYTIQGNYAVPAHPDVSNSSALPPSLQYPQPLPPAAGGGCPQPPVSALHPHAHATAHALGLIPAPASTAPPILASHPPHHAHHHHMALAAAQQPLVDTMKNGHYAAMAHLADVSRRRPPDCSRLRKTAPLTPSSVTDSAAPTTSLFFYRTLGEWTPDACGGPWAGLPTNTVFVLSPLSLHSLNLWFAAWIVDKLAPRWPLLLSAVVSLP